MNPFKNFFVNLTATGSWAILGVLAICISALAFAPEGELSSKAMTTLTGVFCFIAGALAFRRTD